MRDFRPAAPPPRACCGVQSCLEDPPYGEWPVLEVVLNGVQLFIPVELYFVQSNNKYCFAVQVCVRFAFPSRSLRIASPSPVHSTTVPSALLAAPLPPCLPPCCPACHRARAPTYKGFVWCLIARTATRCLVTAAADTDHSGRHEHSG